MMFWLLWFQSTAVSLHKIHQRTWSRRRWGQTRRSRKARWTRRSLRLGRPVSSEASLEDPYWPAVVSTELYKVKKRHMDVIFVWFSLYIEAKSIHCVLVWFWMSPCVIRRLFLLNIRFYFSLTLNEEWGRPLGGTSDRCSHLPKERGHLVQQRRLQNLRRCQLGQGGDGAASKVVIYKSSTTWENFKTSITVTSPPSLVSMDLPLTYYNAISQIKFEISSGKPWFCVFSPFRKELQNLSENLGVFPRQRYLV